jgi:uncharacterized membrane protein YhaH (DUF805 family)
MTTLIWLVVLFVVGPAIIAVSTRRLKPIHVYGVFVLLVTLALIGFLLSG